MIRDLTPNKEGLQIENYRYTIENSKNDSQKYPELNIRLKEAQD